MAFFCFSMPQTATITSEVELRKYLPNVFATVKGEVSLFDKVKVDIDLAENWVIETFTSVRTFNAICGYVDDNPIRIITAKLIASEALRRAIPSLDLVLTPNGFGVVSNQNIAPASKERVDRLIGSLADYRDECIANLLPALVGASKWLTSSQAQFFGPTLFPDLAIVDSLGTVQGSRWEKYIELRSQVIDLEASLAEEWLSPELMSALRSENLRGDLTDKRIEIARQVKAQVVGYLRSGSLNSRRLADIVNYIRLNPEFFSEWHTSETAKLFATPVFRNEKKASGYFF